MNTASTDHDRSVRRAHWMLHEGRENPPSLLADRLQRSWTRSRGYGLDERDRVLFNPVSAAHLRRIGEAHRSLLIHAEPEMQRLFAALDSRHWALSCIEPAGDVIQSYGGVDECFRDISTVVRPGLNLSERVAGTTAPGCVLEDECPVVVSGGDHFLEEARRYTCVAVPIFHSCGRLAGVLNALRHHGAAAIGILEPLALTARAIENRMVRSLPSALCLCLHYSAELALSSMCGLLAFSENGRLIGANSTARHLLELDLLPESERSAQTLFQQPLGPLFDLLRQSTKTPLLLHCRNGVLIHAFLADDAASRPVAAAPAARAVTERSKAKSTPAMLADSHLQSRICQAMRAFSHDIPILIGGETGTGKEVLARHLHEGGPRASGPFVAINCSAIPAGLIESELFGYDNGAFTGARRGGMAGRLEQANGGTLFLDEIGDMPIELQARLLRVLQERMLTRLGSTRSITLDCSVVCATHRDLAQRVAAGEFREDLYYRINGLRVTLPALRERGDLDELIDHLLAQSSAAFESVCLSPAARRCLHLHHWPGNIRELQQVIRVGCALAESGLIDLAQLPPELTEGRQMAVERTVAAAAPATTLYQAESEAVRVAFERHAGNVSATARALGITRATLYRKLRSYGISDPGEGSPRMRAQVSTPPSLAG